MGSFIAHQVPKDLRRAVHAGAKARTLWEDITPLARNEWICWVTSAKKAIPDAVALQSELIRRGAAYAGRVVGLAVLTVDYSFTRTKNMNTSEGNRGDRQEIEKEVLEEFPKECNLASITIQDFPFQDAHPGGKMVDLAYKDGDSYTLFVNEEGRVVRIVHPRVETEQASGWTAYDWKSDPDSYMRMLDALHDDILDAGLSDDHDIVLAMKPLED